jgi:two-component system, chemotaxis family, chemotaxis protein CheY
MSALILIVEDDPVVRRTLELALRSAGFDAIPASNGQEGIALFRLRSPHVVVTDILMPEQDGIETILQIRREAPATKIIAISGGGSVGHSDFLEIATKLGANVVLAKPVAPAALIEAVRKCVDEM